MDVLTHVLGDEEHFGRAHMQIRLLGHPKIQMYAVKFVLLYLTK